APGGEAQRRGFPAARGPDDADELARRDAQIDVVERQHPPGAADIFLAQMGDVDRSAPPLDHGDRSPRARAYWWRMIFSENRYSFFGIMRLLVAHDLIRKPVPTFRDHARSAAAGELARLVLELPRRQLGQRVIDVAGIEQPLRRQLDVAHLVLHEPGLHVEHAGDVDRAVR